MHPVSAGHHLYKLLITTALSVFILSTLLMLRKQEPFYSWYYCFAWWSYIVGADLFLKLRTGESTVFNSLRKAMLLMFLSASTWLVFEAFNFRLQNWHYLDLPHQRGLRWFGYMVSFATVIPGILVTARLLEYRGLFQHGHCPPLAAPHRLYRPFILTGVGMLLLPLLWPQFFFPLVWGAFIFLLEPLNHRFGAPSLLREWESGSLRRFFLLLIAGAICGFLWELWNFRAGSKWVYSVPYVGWLKIFEMPILGFLGFPPFAVECFVMMSSFLLLRDSLKGSRSPLLKLLWLPCLMLIFVLDLLVLIGIDHFTVRTFKI